MSKSSCSCSCRISCSVVVVIVEDEVVISNCSGSCSYIGSVA